MTVLPLSVVLVVSEDKDYRESVKTLVESAGLRAKVFPTLQALLDAEAPPTHACLVLHSEKNALNDPVKLVRLRSACDQWPGILMTERDNVRAAVQASKAGILHIMTSPYQDRQLLERIVHVLDANATT